MVSIVTGQGLGLERGSGSVLGSRGSLGDAAFGRYGEKVTVNAATGNLVINRADEILIGRGPDNIFSRSYNSLGALNDDNGDNWRLGAQRKVSGLTGTVNTAGSTITRTDWDGSEIVYSWDASASAYVSKTGAGAYDRLTYAANVWTWTDGDSRVTESYDNLNGGRITSSTDTSGNSLTYTYTGALLTKIATASGEYTTLSWTGNNLTQVVTTKADATTLTRVRYAYDSSDRLASVTTDLTPGDNSVTDGQVVVTTYTYDGTSRRVASISQTGGASLAIAYTLVGGTYRVASLTQTVVTGQTRLTSFTYDTTNNITTIRDPLNQDTKLTYDASGQLTQIELPAVQSGASTQIIQYTYNANGDVSSAKDASNNVVVYTYDTNGNLTLERDVSGNAVTYTYGSKNELLTRTTYTVPDPDGSGSGLPSGATTSRYAYDAQNRLRFTIDAEGGVTENIFNSYGQLISTIAYRDQGYDVSALSATATLSETTMAAWAAAITDKSTIARTDTAYDFRGNVTTVKSFSAASAAGVGSTTKPYTLVTYVYDQFGSLLSRQTSGITSGEVFAYDGLGRLISATDLGGATTQTVFNNALNTTVVTLANGFVQTSNYNLAGELISYVESGTGYAATTATYKYDALGRLRMVTDATGRSSYHLYDGVGRKVADIGADGSTIEYRYDASDRLIRTVRYAVRLTATQLALLVDVNGQPASIALPTISNTGAEWEWRIYDKSNRLIQTIDGTGAVVNFAYDGKSAIPRWVEYATRLSSTLVNGFKTTSPTARATVTADATKDVTHRTFFDKNGREIASLDGLGYLTQTIYNEAGEVIEKIAFATAASQALRAAGTFAELLASVGTSSLDRHERSFYDGQGLLRFTLDAALRPIEYVYNAAGQLLHTTEYADSIAPVETYSLSYVQAQVATTPISTNTANRTSRNIYDAKGRLAYVIDPVGNVIGYRFDALSRIVKQTAYPTKVSWNYDIAFGDVQWSLDNTTDPDDRVNRYIYDIAGRIAYEVNAEGYVVEHQYDSEDRLTADIRYPAVYTVDDSVTAASLAALIGTTVPPNARTTSYSYDARGLLSDSYDPEGIRTSFVYDALGRVITKSLAAGTADESIIKYAYDGAGNLQTETVGYGSPEASVTRYDYNAFGQVIQKATAYGTSSVSTTTYAYDFSGLLINETRGVGTADASSTIYGYDGFHQLIDVTDGRGFTTHNDYDAVGNLTVITRPISDVASNVTTNIYDSFGNIIKSTDGRNNSRYFFYDKMDRQICVVDEEGYVTKTTFGLGSEITKVVRYFNKLTNPIMLGVVPSAVADSAEDATTAFTRDRLGRVTRSTDAMDAYETYTYNAFGDRVQMRNKLGGVTTYAYDKRGLVISETLPVSSTRADGTAEPTNIVNRFEYDARGNRKTMIEASGFAEQRTTSYAYDDLDRLIQTTGDQLTVLNPATMATSTIVPVETRKYDARNNLIEIKDAAGARTLSYYDALNRKIMEINAAGTVSKWTYDTNGNILTARVYEDAVTLPAVAGGSAPAPANLDKYRLTSFVYDRANRLTSTTVAGVTVARYAGSGYVTESDYVYTANTSIVTRNIYNSNGDIIQQVDGNEKSTFYYYDKDGHKVAQVDAGNYLTFYELDADGNVTREERYATRLAATPGVGSDPAALRASVNTSAAAEHANDRVTIFTYDKNGRRLTEQRQNVEAWQIDGTTGGMTAAATTATITYTYNALGLVLSRTEATGDKVTYTYDTMGRQLTVTGASFLDQTGASVANKQVTVYNGLNDVTRTVENTTRISTFTYGAGGRLLSSTSPIGAISNYSYDATGRLTATTYQRAKSDGSLVEEAQVIQYDVMGRQTAKRIFAKVSGTWVKAGDSTESYYNAYGDVIARGINSDGNLSVAREQEFADYDNAGRIWRTNFDDGVTKAYAYDAAGNATILLQTAGSVDLRTRADIVAIFNDLNNGAATATISIYDARSQLIDTIQAQTMNEGANPIHAVPYATIGDGQKYFGGGGGVASTENYAWTGVVAGTIPSGSSLIVSNGGAVSFVQTYAGNYTLTIPPGYMNNGGGNIHLSFDISGQYNPYWTGGEIIPYHSSGETYINLYNGECSFYIGVPEPDNLTFNLHVYQDMPDYGVKTIWHSSWGPTVYGRDLQIQGLSSAVTATQVWYRPWGSSGPWTHLGAGAPLRRDDGSAVAGWFNQSLYGLGDSGQYEMWVQAYDAAGNLYDNKTLWLHDGIADWVGSQPAVGGPAGAALGRYYSGSNPVDIITFSGLPATTTSMTMRWRTIGSSTWNVTYPWNGGWGQNGYWVMDISGWGSNIEYWIEPRDAGGNLVAGKIYGQFSVGNGQVSTGQFYDLPERVKIIPPSGQNITYQQVQVLKDGAWQNWTVNDGGGEWNYDTNWLVPDRYYSYSYPVRYEAYGPDGLLSRCEGTLNVGYNGRGISLASVLSNIVAKVEFAPYNQPNGNQIKLYWRDKGTTGAFQLATIFRTANKFGWDVDTAVDAAGNPVRPASGSREIEYYYDLYDVNGSLLPTTTGSDHAQGYITIYNDRYVDTSNREIRWVIDTSVNANYLIHRSQQYNAFGEIISETDGNGNTRTMTYNTEGRLLSKQSPLVDVAGENGVTKPQRPTEYYYYDISGRQVGQRDANGRLTTQKLLAGAGYGGGKAIVVGEFRPDGTKTRYGIDVFGNVRTITDGAGNVTTNLYDQANNLTQVAHANRSTGNSIGTQLIDYYAYDVLGQRIKHWNSYLGGGYVETTDYDAQGRVKKTVTLGGLQTTYDYNYYNGSVISTSDLGDFGGWQVITTNSAGLTSRANSDIFGRIIWQQDFGNHAYLYAYDLAGRLINQTNGDGQNIGYAYYKNGYIKSITDNALGIKSTFAYDNDGNRTLETYNSINGISKFYQNSTIEYDDMNRIVSITDQKAVITYKYDAAGNRMNVKSVYTDGLGNNAIPPQDYWYKYDSLNRFVQTMGTLSGGVIVNGADGAEITYDAAGNRATATYGSDGHKEVYSYTADGYLENMTINGVLRAQRTNDAMGRVTNYKEYNTSGGLTLDRTSTYDRDSRLATENTRSFNGVWSNNNQIFDYKLWNGSSYSGADQGVVTHVQSQQFLDSAPTSITTTQTNYYYKWWSEAKQLEIRVGASNPSNPNNNNWAEGLAKFSYDVNGHIKQLEDVRANRLVTYQNDAYGQVLVREEWVNSVLGPRQLYYYFNGNRIGDVGNNGPAASRVDYATALASSQSAQGAENAGKGGFRYGRPVASADFDQSFQPINASYPAAAASYYTVAAGDTLRSIAQRVWGDSAFWYLIADANGLTSENALVAGLRLIIPNKVANSHNNTTTFRPYDPGEAIGDTLPTLPPEPAMPAPAPASQRGGCGVFGQILLAVVAVAVTIIALPTAPGALSLTTLGQGALAAAAGSVASQTVGLVTGIQKKFSFANVALAAVGGGISAGLAGSFGWAGQVGGGALRGAVGNLATQGIGVATGLQSKFDWAGVATAGIGGAMNGLIGGGKDFGSQLGRSSAELLASAAARSLISGDSFGDSINAVLPSVIANTIGNLVADQVAGRGTPKTSGSRAGGFVEKDGIVFNQDSLNETINGVSLLDLDTSVDPYRGVMSLDEARAYNERAGAASGDAGTGSDGSDTHASTTRIYLDRAELDRAVASFDADERAHGPYENSTEIRAGIDNNYAILNKADFDLMQQGKDFAWEYGKQVAFTAAGGVIGRIAAPFVSPLIGRASSWLVGDSLAAAEGALAAEGIGARSLDPTKLSFTQSSISFQKAGANYNLDTLVESMSTRGWVGKPIDVVSMPDGTLATIDNSRVLAARIAGIDVQANVRGFGEAIADPVRRATLTEAGNVPKTWGDAALLRINKPIQNATYPNMNPAWSARYPYGSIYDPIVK